MSTLTATNENRFHIGQWLLLSDYGELARRNMAVCWTCVAGLGLVVSIWWPRSSLSFDQASVSQFASSLIYGAAACIFYLTVSYRLRRREDPIAALLRAALERFALLFRGYVSIAAIGSVGVIFSYLAVSSAPPLQDAFLARLDSYLGFHWPSFLGALNDRPFLADLLVKAYASTGLMTQAVVVWLSIRGCGERLSEFLAVLCLSILVLAVGMVLFPAAGASAYFEPAPQSYEHFTAGGEMWSFLNAFNGLRDGSLTKIDVSQVQGVVSFPSFHTMLGVVTTYALRDTRALLVPAAIVNGAMIVATLPVGGHYLMDTLVGAAISIAAFHALRHGVGRRAASRGSIAAVGVDGMSLSEKPALHHSFLQPFFLFRSYTLEWLLVAAAACSAAYVALENLPGRF